MPKFRCEHCNQKIAAPDAYVGRRVRCPRCKKPARVPKAVEPPVELAPSIVPPPRESESEKIPPVSPAIARAERVEPPAPTPEPEIAPAPEQEPLEEPPPLFGEWMSGPAAEVETAPPPPEESQPDPLHAETHPSWSESTADEHHRDQYEEEEPEPALEPPAEIVVPPAEVIDRPARHRKASSSADEVADLLHTLRPHEEHAVEQFAAAGSSPAALASSPVSEVGAVRVLGWVSIVLGVIAIAMGCLSALSPVAIPVGAGGLLLALVGLFLATTGRPTRFRLPLGGAMASAAGMSVAILGACGILPIGAKDTLLRVGSTPAVNVAENGSSASNNSVGGSELYIPATSPAIANHVEIRIASARILQPVVYTGDYSSLNTISERRMQITLELKALGTDTVTYEPWRKNGAGADEPMLFDSQGKQLTIDVAANKPDVAATLPVGSLKGTTSIRPGGRAADVLLFEPPDNPRDDLKLDLPGANIGAPNTIVHIRIPSGMVLVQAQ